jgi:hypothetical protein
MCKRILPGLAVLLALPAAAAQAENEQQQDSPEVARLKERNALLEQQLALIKNQASLVRSVVPTGITPLEGKLQIDGEHPLKSQILAYQKLNEIAGQIAGDQKIPGEGTIVIYSEAELNSLLAYQAFQTQTTLLKETMDKAAKHAREILDEKAAPLTARFAPAALGLIGGGLSAILDILALFRSDVTIQNKDFTIGDLPLITATAKALATDKRHVYYPAAYAPKLLEPSDSQPLLNDLKALNDLRFKLEGLIREANAKKGELTRQIEALGEQIETAEAKKALAALKTAQKNLEDLIAWLGAIRDGSVTFQTALLKPEEGSGQSALARLLRAEKLQQTMAVKEKEAHTLLLKVLAAGGSHLTKKLLWRNPKLYYSGGAIATYALFAPQGHIVTSGSVPLESGYQREKLP